MYLQPSGSPGRRRGAVLLLTAACFTGILFLTAMAIDSGNLMAARRHAQNCVDAAALAGAIKVSSVKATGQTPTQQQVKDAVNLSASNNNFVDGSNCTITVNYPPTSGGFQDDNSVEVLLKFTRNNLVVSGGNSVTVRAVASCQPASAASFPMLILDPSAAQSFWINNGSLTLSQAPVQVNSSDSNAASVTGSGSKANTTVRAVGGSSGAFTPAAKVGGSPIADPFALLPTPDPASMTVHLVSDYLPDASGNITLDPGYYPNGLYVNNGGNVKLNPGLYYVEGGNVWINTSGSVTGNGVTIYHNGANATAKLNVSYGLDVAICLCLTDNNYSFTPPTTGPYAGVSFFTGRNTTSEVFYDLWGKGNLNAGIQYAPNSTLRAWSANKGGAINSNELVSRKFLVTGPHEIYGNSQNGGFSKVTWNAPRATNRPPTSVFLAE